MSRWLLPVFALSLAIMACSFISTSEALPTPTTMPLATTVPATRTPVFSQAPTEAFVEAPIVSEEDAQPEPTLTEAAPVVEEAANNSAVPVQPTRLEEDHYWFSRPIPDGYTDYLDRTYPYGGTSNGKYRPHTGVEFVNEVGTSVLAVDAGIVYFAGEDTETLLGPSPGFYGNVVVIEHTNRSYQGEAVYTLYGHLSEINVEQGEPVSLGTVVGEVGGTGAANGAPHLHFEVRVGEPVDYFASTRNPDLWISPYFGFGTLVGRIVDADGNTMSNVSITVRGEGYIRYTWTYSGDENQSDAVWGENFTYGDLPEGLYTVETNSGTRSYIEEIYIEPGQSNWIEIVFE